MDLQPRHTPGYAGHQPTMQDRFGETFGTTSHNIFQDPDAPRARRVSDSSFDFNFGATSTPRRGGGGRDNTSTPFAQRIDNLNFSNVSTPGDEDRRGGHHLTGYTGHVPTERSAVGASYGATTFGVLRDDSLPRARRLSDYTPRPQRDLVASRSEVHLPGYAGHVPTARDRVGETFGNTTYTVLRDDSLPRARRLSDSDAFRVRDEEEGIHGRTPGYAGHVPSLRQRVGATYQRDTADLIRDEHVYQGRRLSEISVANTSIQECPHEPSYVAGYAGHTPGLQHRVGETFGKATHDLMTDESNLVRRRMSDVTPGQKVIVNRQETSITTDEGGSGGLGIPEPYYIPGYTGFAPQLQFRMGETYGRATHELLIDPTVDHARQLALSNRSADDVEVLTQTATQTTSVEGTHPISKRPTIPGYDAFVARMRGKRGQRFAINVRQTNTTQEITKRPRSTTTRET